MHIGRPQVVCEYERMIRNLSLGIEGDQKLLSRSAQRQCGDILELVALGLRREHIGVCHS